MLLHVKSHGITTLWVYVVMETRTTSSINQETK